jgi:hypothetical protein
MSRETSPGPDPKPLARARAVVDEERGLLAAERDAFGRFRSLVADVDAAPAPAPRRTAGGATLAGGAAPALDRVRRAYERTVMDVPHYESEYGEGYARNLSAEFGDDIAAALTRGGAFTPDLRRVVVAAAGECRSERETLLSLVDGEREEVAEAEAALSSLDRRLDRLTDRDLSIHDSGDLWRLHERLGSVTATLDDLAAARQETLGTYRRETGRGVESVPGYLYADEPFTFPVLRAVARRGETAAAARRRVRRSLTRRD